MERLRQKRKNKTKSNINEIVRTYLLCMKKGVSSVDEKITRNDNNKLRLYITPLGYLVKATKWPKILECCLTKKRKAI